MYGLIIKKKWLDLIMSGKKTLEIRGCRTSHVGEEIALLESGSQKIRGFCTIKEEWPWIKENGKHTGIAIA